MGWHFSRRESTFIPGYHYKWGKVWAGGYSSCVASFSFKLHFLLSLVIIRTSRERSWSGENSFAGECSSLWRFKCNKGGAVITIEIFEVILSCPERVPTVNQGVHFCKVWMCTGVHFPVWKHLNEIIIITIIIILKRERITNTLGHVWYYEVKAITMNRIHSTLQ